MKTSTKKRDQVGWPAGPSYRSTCPSYVVIPRSHGHAYVQGHWQWRTSQPKHGRELGTMTYELQYKVRYSYRQEVEVQGPSASLIRTISP